MIAAFVLGFVWRIEKLVVPMDEDEPDEGHLAPGELVESRSDAPALLEPSDAALHLAAAVVGAPVRRSRSHQSTPYASWCTVVAPCVPTLL